MRLVFVLQSHHAMKLCHFLLALLLIGCTACMDPKTAYLEATTSQDTQDSPIEAIPPGLVIYALDVGQGDATLVVGPNGRVGLIDAGPPFSGRFQILPKLQALDIDQLDWIITSHFDADHMGGLLEVMMGADQRWDTGDDITVTGFVWDRGGTKFDTTPWFDDYEHELGTRDLRQTITVGQSFDLGDGATMTVYLSDGEYLDGTVRHLNANEENEASIALLIEYGNFRYLTAGDLTGGGLSGTLDKKDLETKLAELVGPVDVVHLNHHGSRTSTNDSYLDRLAPEAALISLGFENNFGHPHEEVMDRLTNRNIAIHRTDEGTVRITTDGESYEIR